MNIDRNSPLPLYYQIKQLIKNKVLSGEFKPHEKIPSEEKLAQDFGVSRLTVRQAITELVNEGVVYRIQGKGTYIAEQKRIADLSLLTGFTEELEKMNKKAHSLVVKNKIIKVSAKIAEKLNIQDKEKALLLFRVRYEGDFPRAVEKAYLNIKVYPEMRKILSKNMEEESLYKILKEELKIFPDYAQEEIEIVKVDEDIAKLLGIKKGECVLHIQRLTFSTDGLPFEYVLSWYRKENFKLKVVLKAK